jgi:hypothetical protein
MNRKNLAAAVLAGLAGAAGIAGTAQAVNLNPDGLGQVLIYPYYTVNGGNLTTLSVVNTSENAKAVKVRFLEGQNSKEVLDFNLYMSAYDVWVAAIVNAGGTPTLIVEDETCTVPDLLRDFGGSQAFLTFGLTDSGGANNDISRTAEGHFEMIEMGTLVGASAKAATHSSKGVPPATNYFAGITTPRPCGLLVDGWSIGDDKVKPSPDDGYWLYKEGVVSPELIDIESPSGGLFGGAAIVNPKRGTMYSYDARAINGFAFGTGGPGSVNSTLHSEPGDEEPSLNDGDSFTGYVFTDNGEVASADYFFGIDAVSYVFMHDTIMNEYVTGGDLTANSEWVITFPTKNFYVNGGEAPIAPFESKWGKGATSGRWEACEPVLLDTVWDQEEQTSSVDTPDEICPPVVSPAPPPDCGTPDTPFELCFETNVLRFGDINTAGAETEILGSKNFTNVDIAILGLSAGWARIDMMQYAGTNAGGVFDGSRVTRDPLGDDTGYDGETQWGLPATGFWVIEANNGYLFNDAGDEVLANYGGLFNHKATRCFRGEGCRFNDSQ